MFTRKLLRVTCAALILMFLVAGCGGGPSTGAKVTTQQAEQTTGLPGSSGDDNVNPAGVFPIVKEPTKMKLAVVVEASVEDISTNDTTLWLEEISGIDFEILELPKQDTMTKVNLIFASGDLPDIVTGLSLPKAALEEFVQAGKLVKLDDYIDKYGVGYKEFLGYLGDYVTLYNSLTTFSDGHKYCLDYANLGFSGVYDGFGSIYKPWVDQMGGKIPTTLDEFYNLMVRFRNEDPNGNKKMDEKPISASSDLAARLISYIGNCYQYTDYTYRVAVKDGILSFVANNDLYKETLQFMNKMLNEGLIDPLLFTQSKAEVSATMALEDLTVGVIITPSISSFMNTTSERCRNFVPLPPLEGPYGFKTAYVRGLRVIHSYIITSSCKNPAAAYRLGDYILSEEGNNRYRYGVKGIDWDDPDPGAVDAGGRPAYIKVINDIWGLTKQNKIWRNNNVPYLLDIRYGQRQFDGDIYEYEAKKYQAALMMEPFAPKEYVPHALPYATAEETARMAELNTAIRETIMEFSVQFIVGDLPFDQWDKYVKALDNIGLDEYMTILQKNYDIVFKK